MPIAIACTFIPGSSHQTEALAFGFLPGPCIPQRHGSVKNQLIRGTVRVHVKIPDPLELEMIQMPGVPDRWFYFGMGEYLQGMGINKFLEILFPVTIRIFHHKEAVV